MAPLGLLLLLSLFAQGVWGQEPAVKGTGTPAPDAGFVRLWGARRAAMATGSPLGEQQLKEMVQLRLDLGIMNLWEYALPLIKEGMEQRDVAAAMKLCEFAQRLAPDLPAAYFAMGEAILRGDRWRISAALERDAEGLRAYLRNIPLLAGALVNVLYTLGLGVILAIATFCLILLWKRLPIYFALIQDELGGDTKGLVRGLARVFVFFLPLLLNLSLPWCLFSWCLILWGILNKGERAALVVSLFLLVYIPASGGALLSYLEGPRAQVCLDIYEAAYGQRSQAAIARLREWAQGHEEDRDALLSLALAAKRSGDYAEAKRYYQQIIKLYPSDAEAISNFGNLYLVQGDVLQARNLYQQAIELDPKNGVYYYNLSKALAQRSLLVLEDADQYFQRAKELSPRVIGAQLEIDSPNPNRVVIDMTIPEKRLRQRFVKGFWEETGLAYFVGDVWLRSLSPRLPFLYPVIFVAVMILFSFVVTGDKGWWRCSLCGLVSNQTVGKKEGVRRICVRCFRILKGKEMDRDLKEEKLRRTKAFQLRMGVYEKILPFLLPGIAHVWKGYNLLGLFYLLVGYVFLVKFYYWQGFFPSPLPSPALMVGGWTGAIVAFVVFYIWVIRGGYRREGLEITKPPFSLEGIRG